ncbi:hypothetical protein LINPERHAP2_LOCUS23378, partial [Linum perenne]
MSKPKTSWFLDYYKQEEREMVKIRVLTHTFGQEKAPHQSHHMEEGKQFRKILSNAKRYLQKRMGSSERVTKQSTITTHLMTKLGTYHCKSPTPHLNRTVSALDQNGRKVIRNTWKW